MILARTPGCHCGTCRDIGHERYVDEVSQGLLRLAERLHAHHTGADPIYPPVRPNEVPR
jgi:hypothetical protein